jgi:hypothetical protein
MLWTRSRISGCLRSCSINRISVWLKGSELIGLSLIPTLFSDMAKFVHFILQKSFPPSPTLNHTQFGFESNVELAKGKRAETQVMNNNQDL